METSDVELKKTTDQTADCGNFLCPGDGSCRNVETKTTTLTNFHYYELIAAVSQILLHVGDEDELKNIFVVAITSRSGWAKYFERRHVIIQFKGGFYNVRLTQNRSCQILITFYLSSFGLTRLYKKALMV